MDCFNRKYFLFDAGREKFFKIQINTGEAVPSYREICF